MKSYFICSIKKDRFIELANEISEIFKPSNLSTEEYSRGFYSPFRKASNGKFFYTSGSLYDKYMNLRKKLLALKLISAEDKAPEGTKYGEKYS